MKRRTLTGLAGVALLAPVWAVRAADRVKVVATFSVIGDMAGRVGGDQIELVTIVGPDGDTEEYTATVGDVPRMANAQVLLMNGLNDEFEPWLDTLAKQAKFSGTKAIVTRGVRAISADDEHPVGGRPKASALDQHAWMDPRNGVIYVRNIADTLARTDAANADQYRGRAAAYTHELRELHIWAQNEIAAVPMMKRRVLASHDSLQYLGLAYGITMISVNGWTNKNEPSAADLARLADQIERDHVKALFLDSITDPRAMQRISQETGAIIGGTLYGDALSKSDGDAPTYVEMIRHDITTLKAGMLLN
jgi:zinc/manganese transport system substrate-binding protein